jgi:hypothetical protein
LETARQTSAKGSAEHEAAFFRPGTCPKTTPDPRGVLAVDGRVFRLLRFFAPAELKKRY